MKKIIFVLFSAMFMLSSCTVVDSGEIGIKFHKISGSTDNYGGVEKTVRGVVWYWPFVESVFTYPTMVQRKNYEPFTINAKDASVFTMDPQIAYHINPEKACDIFVKYRKPIKELEDGYIRTCIYEAYRTCGNAYTSDSLMSNRARFESDVRSRLEKSLAKEGFIVDEFTSAITPPKSLSDMIDAKNRAVQASLKAENLVKEAEANAKIAIAKARGEGEAMRIKADAEAYYNKAIAASLTQYVVLEDYIEKWDGHLPAVAGGQGMMFDMSKFIK